MKKSYTDKSKKLLSLILAGILAASSAAMSITAKADETAEPQAQATPDQPTGYRLADSIQDGTILHCFTWKYRDITAELPSIAKAGFTSIQVSPAQNAFYEYYPWYIVYQPYGLKFYDPTGIETKGGSYMNRNSILPSQFNTREELVELCSEAEKYGINIIMDVVANHLAKEILVSSGDELAKDEYWHEHKPITNYNRRSNITNGSLSGLTDLNTEHPYVQQLARDYGLELKSLGVDGIRWDAAKHIALPSEGSDFWKTATDNGLYNYGEILSGPVDGKDHDELMAEYAQYMSVTDSDYSSNIGMAFTYKKVPTLDGNRPDSIKKSEIFEGEKGSMHFVDPGVSAVNHFHNAMIGKKDCYAASDNVAVVTRENGGAVIVCGDEPGEIEIENAGGYAVPGTYIDEVSGNTFVVTEDTIKGTVGETGIAVIYDSPFLGSIYAEDVKSKTFKGEMSVTLRSVLAENTQYKLTETTNGEAVSVETNDFADREIVTFGKGVNDASEFTLELSGKSVNGSELHETYRYYSEPNLREIPAVSKKLTHITFDNKDKNWSDVYIHISFNGMALENAEFPGEKMTDMDDQYFVYEMPETFNNSKTFTVTFSDGKDNTISKTGTGQPMISFYNCYGIVQGDSEWISNYYGMVGDVNNDGKVTSKDALKILRASISSADHRTSDFGDIDKDNKLTAKDALFVLRYTINLTDNNPAGLPISI